MIDEANVKEVMDWWYQHQANVAIAALKKRRINAVYVPDKKAALAKVLEMIPEGATVARGGSVTLEQIGAIAEMQRTRGKLFIDPLARDANGELVVTGMPRIEVMRKALTVDVFLTGVNAITKDGKLVSVDATGNRVAPTIFGPRKVIIVAGVNKIVENLDDAMKRVKEWVGPINAKRQLVKHDIKAYADLPCVKSGKCVDCYHPDRTCMYTIIIEGEKNPPWLTEGGYVPRLNVIIVGEDLGT